MTTEQSQTLGYNIIVLRVDTRLMISQTKEVSDPNLGAS